MKTLVVTRKITLSIPIMIALLCGSQGISYGETLFMKPGETRQVSRSFSTDFSYHEGIEDGVYYVEKKRSIDEGLSLSDAEMDVEGYRDQFLRERVTIEKVTFTYDELRVASGVPRGTTLSATIRYDVGVLIRAIDPHFFDPFTRRKTFTVTFTVVVGDEGTPGITPDSPDLVVLSPRVNESTLAPGERFTLSATVKNSGEGQASSTTLRYYRSTDSNISSRDTQVGTDRVSALGANRTENESISLNAPMSPGTYYYGVCVDSVTDESNRNNNCLPGVKVSVVRSSPDLVVEAVRATPATVAPGEKFRLYATLKNQGTAASAATKVRYYRSTDRVITPRDTQLSSANRDPLVPNATLRRYLTVTAQTTPGTYYYGVCVDSVTGESDTDNNCAAAVRVTVTAPPVVAEDVNEDGTVDVQDLVVVAQRYGQTGTTPADVNGDGVVNVDDLILVAAVLDADAASAPSLRSDALEGLTVADVKVWLSQARQRNMTDPSVRRGIQFLEGLLASMVPKETALLANYPNPFNPETWIPYQLSKPAEVRITIYAANGHAIRQLALGHQPAGAYQNRSRAAYWDGRNALGEPVASGVYFYTLTAGDFTATRKMLIRK